MGVNNGVHVPKKRGAGGGGGGTKANFFVELISHGQPC